MVGVLGVSIFVVKVVRKVLKRVSSLTELNLCTNGVQNHHYEIKYIWTQLKVRCPSNSTAFWVSAT